MSRLLELFIMLFSYNDNFTRTGNVNVDRIFDDTGFVVSLVRCEPAVSLTLTRE